MDSSEMKNLSPPAGALRSDESRPRHYSLGNLAERIGSKEPLSVRLSSSYRSARCLRRRDLPERIVVIDEEPEDDASAKNVQEIDAGQPPPVDESLFFDNLETLRDATINGSSLKSAMWSVVSVGEMKMLLEMERGDLDDLTETDFPTDGYHQERLKNIAYVWACFRGLDNVLPRLEAAGASVDYVEPCTGINAILAAALSGSVACLKHLIDRGADVNYVSSINNYTPLHFAAFGNSRESAKLLLDNGAHTEKKVW